MSHYGFASRDEHDDDDFEDGDTSPDDLDFFGGPGGEDDGEPAIPKRSAPVPRQPERSDDGGDDDDDDGDDEQTTTADDDSREGLPADIGQRAQLLGWTEEELADFTPEQIEKLLAREERRLASEYLSKQKGPENPPEQVEEQEQDEYLEAVAQMEEQGFDEDYRSLETKRQAWIQREIQRGVAQVLHEQRLVEDFDREFTGLCNEHKVPEEQRREVVDAMHLVVGQDEKQGKTKHSTPDVFKRAVKLVRGGASTPRQPGKDRDRGNAIEARRRSVAPRPTERDGTPRSVKRAGEGENARVFRMWDEKYPHLFNR